MAFHLKDTCFYNFINDNSETNIEVVDKSCT